MYLGKEGVGMRQVFAVSSLIVLFAGGCWMEASSTSPPPPATSQAVAVAVKDEALAVESPVVVKVLNYDQIQELIASHKGKVVVMDAWSTSCEPCLKEFPNLVALHRKYGPANVACISLSFDYEGLDSPDEVKPKVEKFLAEQGATFDNVISNLDSESLYKKFDLAIVPAVFVYDKEGKLAKRFDNERVKDPKDAFNYENVGELVAKLVEATP
jgi:thiol-disulfide isomerase/thioredoxin